MASNVRRRINQHVNGFEQYAGADKKEIWISYLKNEFFKDRQIEQITLAKFEQWISAQGVDAERRGKEFYILNSHLSEVPNSVNKIFTEMAKW